MNISQVVVSDPNGKNLALNTVIYATSIIEGAQKPSVVVDGNTSYRNYPHIWQSNGFNRNLEFLEIDLGSVFLIDKIRIIGRNNCNGYKYCENRMLHLRVEINSTTSPSIKEYYDLQWMARTKTKGIQSPNPILIPTKSTTDNSLLANNADHGKYVFSLNPDSNIP